MNYKEPNLSFSRKALGIFGIFILMLGCTPDDPPGGAEGDIANGKDDFNSGCISCHAPVGNGTFVNLDIDQLTSSTAEQIGLVDYIRQYMPPTPDSEQRCGQVCATNIVAYLRDEKSQGGSVAIDGDAHLRGEGRFDEACETCHQGERTLGLFDDASLASKNIYRRDQLIEYIAQSMPPNNPSACTGACAEEIAAYIYTWSVLPIDPAAGRDLVSGRQDKPIKSYQCNQSQAFGDRQLKLLNHQEYANSLRDLFNYTEDLSTLLPAEGTVGNFKNNRQIFIPRFQVITAIFLRNE